MATKEYCVRQVYIEYLAQPFWFLLHPSVVEFVDYALEENQVVRVEAHQFSTTHLAEVPNLDLTANLIYLIDEIIEPLLASSQKVIHKCLFEAIKNL